MEIESITPPRCEEGWIFPLVITLFLLVLPEHLSVYGAKLTRPSITGVTGENVVK
jgi:hypothetical protein